mgnify:CR=1 FL=1
MRWTPAQHTPRAVSASRPRGQQVTARGSALPRRHHLRELEGAGGGHRQSTARGAADAMDHCAFNVALYGAAGKRWAMTERGARHVERHADVLRVGPSAIDGQGGFAAEPIPARRKIGEIRGESISVAEARRRAAGMARIMIVELSDKKAIDFSKSADPMRYTNHSCQPNARLCIRQGRVEFYALRDINPGEEITVDYGETHHEGRLRCRCGVAGCRGAL